MSTRLQRVQLTDIWSYGREALTNRRKELFFIALFFALVPELLDLFIWQSASLKAVLGLTEVAGRSPIEQIEHLLSVGLSVIALPTILLGLVKALGILMLARTCIDYFESSPKPFGSVVARSFKVLLTKGLGVILALVIIMPVTSVIPFLAVLTLSLLVMLPVTMVTSTKGGLKTTFDTLFLNYTTAARVGGKLPIFMNIVTVAGFFLTLLLGIEFLLEQIPEMDVLMETPSRFFDQDINILGYQMNAALFLSKVLDAFWQVTATTIMIPFTAAIYHLTTAPEGHQDFETVV